MIDNMTNLATRLNSRSSRLCETAIQSQDLLDVGVSELSSATLLDFGVDRAGQMDSGVLLARICMADLASVSITRSGSLGLPMVEVATDHPLWSCMASQYAGWPFAHEKYFAMGSGPARMARGGEEMLEHLGLVNPAEHVVGVLETNTLPGEIETAEFLRQCNATSGFICVARTASLPGTIQVVARSIETTLHKLHELNFDLRKIRNALGTAPLPPVAATDLDALGWTNDSILYGSESFLWVDTTDAEIEKVFPKVPSCSSSDFGRPFSEIFDHYDRDFYKIDRMLFSPARVVIQNLRSGNTFAFGEVRNDILRNAFRLTASFQ